MPSLTAGQLNQSAGRFEPARPAEPTPLFRDRRIVRRHHNVLMQGAERFTQVFYDYLQAFPATAEVLEEYQQAGGRIDDLVQKQMQHLFGLLAGNIDEKSARHLARVGELHYHYRIDPVWIMGAYLLYLTHLQRIIHDHPGIHDRDRIPLSESMTKLLFRDMGLMLEAYWETGGRILLSERDKVSALQAQITSLLANIPQLLWSVDVVHSRMLYVSPVARDICSSDMDLPIPCLGWTVDEDRDTVRLAWQEALAGNKVEVESRVEQAGGGQRWFRRTFYPYKNADGDVVRIDGLMEDTTDAKHMVERLQTLATTDDLTGLPNRTLLRDRLQQAVASARRSGDRQVVLMLMDLDRFKEINDTLGHPAGDQMLIMVTHCLRAALRDSDTLARLGGDEFAILLPDVADGMATAEKVVAKLTRCFTDPFYYGDNELYLGGSIGIVICPDHGEDVDTLLSRADVAMYGSKTQDTGYLFYHIGLDPDAQQRLQLSSELRHASRRGELHLCYQPKVDIRTGRVTGVEALIRWSHPRHGLLSPDRFIPLAERSGLIRPITDWVMETAIRQCRQWGDAGYQLQMAINVSGRVFQDRAVVDRVSGMLRDAGTPPECLEFELTENVLMTDIEHISNVLKQLSELGVTIAIDDSGTGYSSLAYLKALPLHTLKIDKSFVLDMATDDNDAAIVRSIVDLGHNLGYQVVAEGIENAETCELLTRLGCDFAQGYYISHPLPPRELVAWLAKAPWAVARTPRL